jgi:TPR repeat protein
MYRIGEGCEVDKQKAYELFKRSAARGDIIAQGELGISFSPPPPLASNIVNFFFLREYAGKRGSRIKFARHERERTEKKSEI